MEGEGGTVWDRLGMSCLSTYDPLMINDRRRKDKVVEEDDDDEVGGWEEIMWIHPGIQFWVFLCVCILIHGSLCFHDQPIVGTMRNAGDA